uniref:Uncharacterized protein n=1 Tax=Sparus aurata TaxID=8175 RepID=A0A671X8T7_SPAAU
MIRPVKHYKSPTVVYLYVHIYSILDVNEKDQTFVSYIRTEMNWIDEYISWNTGNFCGIERIYLSNDQLWKPDLIIEEMTDKDKINENPYIAVTNEGQVFVENDIKVISTCEMKVYKFPFDSQSCNLTFRSAIHPDKEILLYHDNKIVIGMELPEERLKSHEWIFMRMTLAQINVKGVTRKGLVVYHITMCRRPQLYFASLILPVLFFLGLDLASFLISNSGGEKLSFKITVLLSVTVMQLILSEILPSTSNRIPLIAIYIMGIFGLMMLSLLETILVMYLLEKDWKENEPNRGQSLSEDCGDKQGKVSLNNCCRGIHSACVCDVSASETPSELLPVSQEVSAISSCSFKAKISSDFIQGSDQLTGAITQYCTLN